MRTRFLWLWMLPLLWLLMALAAPKMNTSLWFDEWYSLYYAGGTQDGLSPAGVLQRIAEFDPLTLPLYSLSLSVWGAAAGWSEFSLRVHTLLSGLLALAVLYALGRDMVSPRAGLYAAVTLGMQAFFIHYLHDARTYTLLLLTGALTLWAYWRLIHRVWRTATLITFFVSSAALLYTHYTALFFCAALGLYHLLFVRKDRRWWWVTLAAAGALLLAVPWLLQAVNAAEFVNRTLPGWTAETNPLLLGQAILLAFGSGSIPLLAFIGFYALRARGHSQRLIGLLLGVTFLLIVFVNYRTQFFASTRYAMLMWLPLAALAGIGIEQMRRAKIPAALVLGIWMLTGISAVYNPQFIVHDPTWHLPLRELRDSLRPHYQRGDVTLFFTPDTLLTARFFDPLIGYYLPDVNATFIYANPELPDDVYFRPMDNAVAGARRAWVTYDTSQVHWRVRLAMDYRLPSVLGFQRCGTLTSDPAVSLTLFARAPTAAPDAPARPAAAFGGVQVFVEAAQRTAGGYVAMLGWVRGANVPIETYSVGVHLLDAAGALVRQDDYGLPNSYACRASGFALAGLPAGTYRAQVTVYEWRTGARLGEPFTLDTIRVP